jgi:hypothetical protein
MVRRRVRVHYVDQGYELSKRGAVMSTLVNGDNLSKVALAESCAQSPRTSFQLLLTVENHWVTTNWSLRILTNSNSDAHTTKQRSVSGRPRGCRWQVPTRRLLAARRARQLEAAPQDPHCAQTHNQIQSSQISIAIAATSPQRWRMEANRFSCPVHVVVVVSNGQTIEGGPSENIGG